MPWPKSPARRIITDLSCSTRLEVLSIPDTYNTVKKPRGARIMRSMQDALLSQLEEAYRSEFRRFLRVATAIVGDEERALDAVQEAFARAVRHRGRFRGEGSFAGWPWHTVVNAARKERARRPDPLVVVVPDDSAAAPEP